MKENTYLSDWIQGKLSDQELQKIEKEASFKTYIKIRDLSSILTLKQPESLSWDVFSKRLPSKETKVKPLFWWYSIAASLILLFGISGFFFSQKTYTATTSYNEINLADGSKISLAPGSKLTHQRLFGFRKRILELKGESFFEVTKGNSFVVNTPNGTVKVLGTKFRVLDTGDFLEVVCTEGKVQVNFQNKTYILTKGLLFNSTDQKVQKTNLLRYQNKAVVYYSKAPLEYILGIVKSIYGIKIQLRSNEAYIFTGAIPLNNKKEALKAISLPFSLQIVKQSEQDFILK